LLALDSEHALEVDKIAMQDRIWIIAVLGFPLFRANTIRYSPQSGVSIRHGRFGLEHRRQSGQTGC